MTEHALSVDVAIIGGGLAGLACAFALNDSGLEVAVFESSPRLGGRAQSWKDPTTGDAIDIGPHIFLSEYRNTLSWLELLDSRERVVWETERLLRLREGGKVTDMHLHRMPAPLHLAPSFAKIDSLSWRDKASNMRMLKLAMRADEDLVRELDGIPASQMLRDQGVSERFAQWFWATACLTVMNVPLEQCSAGALLRVFAQLIGRQRYQIGFAGCGLSELFVPGAIRHIERGRGHVHLNAAVERIVAPCETVEELVLSDNTRVRARHYVSALPPQSLFAIIDEHWRSRSPFESLTAFEPSPYISIYLWFDRKLSQERFWTQVWSPMQLNSDFYDLSNIRPEWKGRASVIASNIIFSHRAQQLSDDAIIEATRREIADAFSEAGAARIAHAAVNRIPMAITCPLPGMEAKRAETASPLANLLIAGDWTRTNLPSCMESAVCSGWKAAETILSTIGRPKRWVLPVKQVDGFVRVFNRRAMHA